jgi:hypothetical protein
VYLAMISPFAPSPAADEVDNSAVVSGFVF